ncbi:MAG TPA: hypothetical protein VHF58_05340 [Solirubrobacterales bacterium]|nr:hypothetical protein [Solirubrobacterales bacterium]
MDLIAAWLLAPALLIVVFAGCGLLVEVVGGRALPASLLPATGLGVVIVLGTALMVADATAELAAPVGVALALAGFALAARRRRALPRSPWGAVAAALVFALYAAPIVLGGEATLAGYIKLDDTATWLAFTDHIAEHGRDLDGLAPSTYEAALSLNVGDGYPIGAFVPLAIASTLTGVDPAWLIQPYMALMAAVLALALWALARPLTDRPVPRLAAAVIGATPALLFGYYLWGGVKEVLAAALLAGLVAVIVPALDPGRPVRVVVPPALIGAAVIAALSGGGAVWLVPLALGACAVLLYRAGPRVGIGRLALTGVLIGLLSLPTLLPGGIEPPTASPLGDSDALGNLAAPLDPLQLAGIWASGDFRFQPGDQLASDTLALLACAAAVATVAWALRRRAYGLPLFVAGVLAGCLALAIAGSPWVEGKAYATASVAIPFAAMLGASTFARLGSPVLGSFAAVAIAAGVLWSYALAYQDASLAPRAHLEELERIGELVDGEGPTLITEYSPYGARHFLRGGDPESVSDLRRREIALVGGGQVPKGESADTDRIGPDALFVYRSLVVRRSPVASRPPSAYRLAWAGEHYELWQRPAEDRAPPERLGLGSEFDPTAVPSCERVRDMAATAPPQGTLVAAKRPRSVVIPLSRTSYPTDWAAGGVEEPRPVGGGTLRGTIDLARAGAYELWLRGSIRPRAEARIDGATLATVRHELNNDGGYVSLGTAELRQGAHLVALEFGGPDLGPGSDGLADPIGPLVLSPADRSDAPRIHMRPSEAAARLCGRAWDWIEVYG